jgi:hypothetical protein
MTIESLTVYAKTLDVQKQDLPEKEHHIGSLITRMGDVYFDLAGPVIGTFYTKATVIYLDEENDYDVREFSSEVILPEGEILLLDFSKAQHGKIVDKGNEHHEHEGIVLGGTGIYSGARGTYTIVHTESEDCVMVTFSLQM